MKIDRRWQFVWAWCLATVLLTACAPAAAPPPRTQPQNGPIGVLATVAGAAAADVELSLHTGETGSTNADGYFVWPSLAPGPRHLVAVKGECRAELDVTPIDGKTWPIALICPEPPKPAFVSTNRPLIGPLRSQDKLLRDDSGWRRVFFASWFTALRTLRDNPTEFYRQIDALAGANYQGARVFLAVGGWSDFWDNHEVIPIAFQKWFYTGNLMRSDRLGAQLAAWSDYDDLFRALLREFKKRNLRLDLTVGDMQIIVGNDQAKELELHRRLSRIAAEEGGLDVIALVEGTNEFPINRYGGDSDGSIEQLGRVLEVWRQAIPGVLTTEGAVISEDPERLYAGARHGQVAAVHISRDPIELHLKRSFGVTRWEGDWRHFPLAFWETEPAGPGRDSFAAQNDPANLTAVYAQHALLGHGSNYFNGPAVRGDGPLESTWGFKELPKILAQLPEDVAMWDHDSDRRGGIEYFFRGNQFATATIKLWSTAPPRPVAEWTLYAGDNVTHGTGNPPAHVTGLLVGRFQ